MPGVGELKIAIGAETAIVMRTTADSIGVVGCWKPGRAKMRVDTADSCGGRTACPILDQTAK